MSEYKVVYERDRQGWWVASVPKIPGCHTQGRTINQSRERTREALGFYIDDAEDAELIDDIRLPKAVKAVIAKVVKTREQVQRQQHALQECMGSAARKLTSEMKLSTRDTGALLGISHQRVQQIAGNRKRRKHHHRRQQNT